MERECAGGDCAQAKAWDTSSSVSPYKANPIAVKMPSSRIRWKPPAPFHECEFHLGVLMNYLTPDEIERIDHAYVTSAIVCGFCFLALFLVAFADSGRLLIALIGG